MKFQKTFLTSILSVLGAAALMFCAVSSAQADDKANVAGTWTWTVPGRNGGPDRTNTLTLKVEGDAVTGSLAVPGRGGKVNKTDIADGKLTGSDVSFKMTRERNGETTTITYNGKVTGDTIEGKIKTQTGDADPRTRTWKATRSTSGT